MNSSSTVSDWNRDLATQLIPNSIFLVLYLSLGIIGNSLVIAVYRFRMKHQSEDRFFIPVLAVCDVTACTVCASMAIALNMMQAKFTGNILCKFLWFFAASTTFMSILLLTIIAINRYLKVCRPFGKQMSTFTKRAALLFAFCFSFLLGAPSAFLYGSVEFSSPDMNLTGRRCSKLKDVSKIASLAYSVLIAVVLLSAVSILIVLYGKIGCKIFTHFKHRNIEIKAMIQTTSTSDSRSQDVAATPSTDQDTIKLDTSSDPHQHAVIESHDLPAEDCNIESHDFTAEDCNIGTDSKLLNRGTDSRNENKKTPKLFTSEELNRNSALCTPSMYKFTLMFMIITVIFLICYIPKIFLIAMEGRDSQFWENLSSSERAGLLFLYRLYILNNVVNPFIYAFMDMKFQNEAKKLLKCIL
ncbi:cholecystokinin receptor type A-like [Mytilus trossulus]|uniref:cholecystokinin receptor type A-like n=1 Tax=Mytilus trossulus TaxID=6551 RepID=UPI003003F5DA